MMEISQTLSEQRKSSPASTVVRKTPSEINEKRSPNARDQEAVASMIKLKRNIKGQHGNNSFDVNPERSASLNVLPIIPEKGDPSLAL